MTPITDTISIDSMTPMICCISHMVVFGFSRVAALYNFRGPIQWEKAVHENSMYVGVNEGDSNMDA